MVRQWHVGALAALTAVALLPGSPLAHAAAEKAPPVVTVALDGSKATLTGADHLLSGWTTFQVSSVSADNNLGLFVARPGATPPAPPAAAPQPAPQPADNTPNAVNPTPAQPPQERPATPAAPVRSDAKTARAQRAKVTAAAEEAMISLGGVVTSKGHDASVTVNLPAGTVFLQDLAAADATKPVAVLSVAAQSNRALMPNVAQIVTVNGKGEFNHPWTLKRAGLLQIENIAHGRHDWHDVVLQKLRKGETRDDVVRYFQHEPGQGGKSPFGAAIAGTAPLSAGHAMQFSYHLPAGTYALYDIWLDHKTGTFYAGQGAVTLISVGK
jgi:hypothetical protein